MNVLSLVVGKFRSKNQIVWILSQRVLPYQFAYLDLKFFIEFEGSQTLASSYSHCRHRFLDTLSALSQSPSRPTHQFQQLLPDVILRHFGGICVAIQSGRVHCGSITEEPVLNDKGVAFSSQRVIQLGAGIQLCFLAIFAGSRSLVGAQNGQAFEPAFRIIGKFALKGGFAKTSGMIQNRHGILLAVA